MTMIQFIRYLSFLVTTITAIWSLIVPAAVFSSPQIIIDTNNKTNASLPYPSASTDEREAIRDAYSQYSSPYAHSLAVSQLDKEVRIMFERQILNTLGIESVPTNLTQISNQYALIFAEGIYSKFRDETIGGFRVDPRQAFIEDEKRFPKKKLSFSIQEAINKSNTIVTCTGAQRPGADGSWSCNVSPTIQNSVGPDTPIHTAQFMLLTSRNVWITRDVTSFVEKWASYCTDQLRILVDIEDVEDSIKDSFLVIYMTTKDQRSRHRTTAATSMTTSSTTATTTTTNDINNKKPSTPPLNSLADDWTRRALNEMKQLDNNPNRKRRSVKTQPSGPTVKSSGVRSPSKGPVINPYHSKYCNLFNMEVDFKQLHWNDWIISPDSYPASYCSGECPFPLPPSLSSSNHAIVQMLVHHMDKSVPKPCCAPTKLLPITVLYYDDYSNVVLRSYKNMMVTSCGCL